LFLTLLLDDAKDHDYWGIYYDITITSKCFAIICHRATELHSSSKTFESWNGSKYARILKFTDEISLMNVRRFWDYYGSMSKWSPRELASFRENFMSEFQFQMPTFTDPSVSGNMIMTGSRSLGPLFREGWQIIPHLFDSVTRTGNVGGKSSKANSHINPLFVYSSIFYDRCMFPPGMSPFAGFHIASSLVSTTAPVSAGLPPYSSNLASDEKVIRIMTYTKDQFKARCAAFQKSRDSITIYHNTDDVVRFCYSVRSILDPSVDNIFDYCSAPWNPPRKFENFSILQSPYGPFDVIETSNLADEIALPTLLISSLPLLKRNGDATLYTTSRVPVDDVPPNQKLKSLLFCEPLTMFALLSCVPVEYVSGFCNRSSLHEAVPSEITGGVKPVWNFSWKWWMDNSSDESIHKEIVPTTIWETETVVKILHEIYCRMFEHEDLFGIPNPVARPLECTRGSFIAFIRFLKDHVKANWKAIVEDELPKFTHTTPTFLPDFILQCHLHQLVTTFGLNLEWGQQVLRPELQDVWREFRSGSQDLPALAIPYILKVPRVRLRHLVPYLKRNSPDRDIVFQIQFRLANRLVAAFSSFEMTFGVFGTEDPTLLFIDYLCWEGKADLFVHVYLPSTLFAFFVDLGCTASFSISYIRERQKYREIYGDNLIVFETQMHGSTGLTHFWPCDSRKTVPRTIFIHPTQNPEPPKVGRVVSGPEIKLEPPGGPLRMTIRLDVYDEKEKADLANGCEVDFHSISRWKISIQTPKWISTVSFPYPHDKSNARLRISRKGGWFEIIARLKTSYKMDTSPFPLFPLVRDSSAMSTTSWNLPRVVTDLLPIVDLSNPHQFEWIRANLKSMFPADEIVVMNKHNAEPEAVRMSTVGHLKY